MMWNYKLIEFQEECESEFVTCFDCRSRQNKHEPMRYLVNGSEHRVVVITREKYGKSVLTSIDA